MTGRCTDHIPADPSPELAAMGKCPECGASDLCARLLPHEQPLLDAMRDDAPFPALPPTRPSERYAALRDAVRAYLAALPDGGATRCAHWSNCEAEAVGVGTNARVGAIIGAPPLVCAEHARHYSTVAPLPARVVALRALAGIVARPAPPLTRRRRSHSALSPRRLAVRAADDARAVEAIRVGAQTRRAVADACGRDESWAQRVLDRLIANGRVVREGRSLKVRL